MKAIALLFALSLPMIQSETTWNAETLPARPAYYKKTLFMDLDETLVYAREREVEIRQNVVETLIQLEKESHPMVDEQLPRWELILWTAGSLGHAQWVYRALTAKGVKIAHVFSNESCGRLSGFEGEVFQPCIKDISDKRFKKDRPLNTMYIVDNASEFCWPATNTIGIRSWYGNNDAAARIWDEREPDSVNGEEYGMKQLLCALERLKRQDDTSLTLENAIKWCIRVYENDNRMIRHIFEPRTSIDWMSEAKAKVQTRNIKRPKRESRPITQTEGD